MKRNSLSGVITGASAGGELQDISGNSSAAPSNRRDAILVFIVTPVHLLCSSWHRHNALMDGFPRVGTSGFATTL
jgi:hypothetical protein